jgi:hypothetical protein
LAFSKGSKMTCHEPHSAMVNVAEASKRTFAW